MYRSDQEAPLAASPDRRSVEQPPSRLVGRLIACNGARATIATEAPRDGVSHDFWSVGRLISIEGNGTRVVGFIYENTARDHMWREDDSNQIAVQVELVGEIADMDDGRARFSRGIMRYPPLGAIAHRIRARDLQAIYDLGGRGGIEIGRLSQDESIAATISAERMLAHHFTIVGTTGVGKSCAASMLVRAAVKARPNLRVLLIDPHNEYAGAFGPEAKVIDPTNLDFPYWILTFEEVLEIVFRGEPDAEEVDALREFIVAAKQRYRSAEPVRTAAPTLLKRAGDPTTIAHTADTPIPYRLADLMKLIDDEQGKLEPRHTRPVLRSLAARLSALSSDPRYAFLFARMGEDTMERVISQIFRIPSGDQPITIFQLAGLPSEVINALVSVMARFAFDIAMWSRGAYEILLMCEEAHRYVPADAKLGFQPTRRAIARIAKEGRKYGCHIGVVTQRPGEIDPSILSQCSTVFAMRLTNDRDQEIVRSAISETSVRMVQLLSSIGDREAIAFGQAVPTPMRMRFAEQERTRVPSAPSLAGGRASGDTAATAAATLPMIIARLRGQAA